ncbi:MAG: (E)-4-hydroxy-3-methylbut-2-enyl-diphosphate synthase [Chlamydiia bacterium]
MNQYNSLFTPTRYITREVKVGKVGVGGGNPVRIQSMTTSSTRDVEATINQVIRLVDAGCEMVRVTVQGMKEADSCELIKNGLVQRGYEVPLIADIHFYPPAAMRVLDFVDKVRINPGNFLDKRAQFKVITYDDATYLAEIAKIEEGFSPLIEKCKKQKKALRIGTNHGSLSDRIMNRYGDTPGGMVESALEFARIARSLDFHDMIFSMKASNPKVMIAAYRLLAKQMQALGWDYPFHLGVTEAGEGEDGRVKSAIGIGTLLLEGIGDTIRVSLTEDPWHEIDPCRRLIECTSSSAQTNPITSRLCSVEAPLHPQGSVLLRMSGQDLLQEDLFEKLSFSQQFGRFKKGAITPDILLLDHLPSCEQGLARLKQCQREGLSIFYQEKKLVSGVILYKQLEGTLYAAEIDAVDVIEEIKDVSLAFLLFAPRVEVVGQTRDLYRVLCQKKIAVPLILSFIYIAEHADVLIRASAECGSLLIDGIGEGVALTSSLPYEQVLSFSFTLLQAARLRTVKTEFISCPGCGRTLFELQGVSKRIREKTSHLPGVKIAIMGCIVNGPGEMADADFGYVGSRPGRIDLYVGKQCVEKNIPFEDADQRLIDLIKQHGRWVEPPSIVI